MRSCLDCLQLKDFYIYALQFLVMCLFRLARKRRLYVELIISASWCNDVSFSLEDIAQCFLLVCWGSLQHFIFIFWRVVVMMQHRFIFF